MFLSSYIEERFAAASGMFQRSVGFSSVFSNVIYKKSATLKY